MKNREASFYLHQFKALEAEFFCIEQPVPEAKPGEEPVKPQPRFQFDTSKMQLSNKFVYGIRANIRFLSSVPKGAENLAGDARDLFKKKNKIDEKKLNDDPTYNEEITAKFKEFMAEKDQTEMFEKYDDQEYTGRIYKIKREHVDECVIPSELEIMFAPFIEDEEDKKDEIKVEIIEE